MHFIRVLGNSFGAIATWELLGYFYPRGSTNLSTILVFFAISLIIVILTVDTTK